MVLKGFEEELWKIVSNVEKKLSFNRFQSHLVDERRIKTQEKIIIKGHKSTNLYLIDNDAYIEKCRNAILTKYKTVTESKVKKINEIAYHLTHQLNIQDRIQVMKTSDVFIQPKDHEINCDNTPEFRLINPN